MWHDEEDKAKGYFQYSVERNDAARQKPDMRINEMIWLDGEAFAGMMAFLNQFAARFNNLFLN